jgi:hypothetical protein
MKQKFSSPAHFLLLLAWFLVTMTDGMVVLCVDHHEQTQLEFTFQKDCRITPSSDDLSCESLTHETCMEQTDCTGIPINLDMMIAPNLLRQTYANMLAVMPTSLNRIASDALRNQSIAIFSAPLAQPTRLIDPATATGSIVLVI